MSDDQDLDVAVDNWDACDDRGVRAIEGFRAGWVAHLAICVLGANAAMAERALQQWDTESTEHSVRVSDHEVGHCAAAVIGARIKAIGHGKTNVEAFHWLAYRLGLCDRPEPNPKAPSKST